MSLRRTDVRGSVRVGESAHSGKRLTAMTDEELLRAQGFERVTPADRVESNGRELYADTAGEGHVVTRETALRWAAKDMPVRAVRTARTDKARGGA